MTDMPIAEAPNWGEIRAALVGALTLAERQFRLYADLHGAKGTLDADEKMATNLRYAEVCASAIARATGGGA